MAKQPDPDRVPEAEAARVRDEALRRMLKTPPKTHRDEPKRKPTRAKQD